jgi:hypothetical protein
VDFIVPKREERIVRISQENTFSFLFGAKLVAQAPIRDEKNYRVWKWVGENRDAAEFVRFTPTPTAEERAAPPYNCLAADFAWTLAARNWLPGEPMYEAPNKLLERTRVE